MQDQSASDPLIIRNKVYNEMRSIALACEKLGHRANQAAAKLLEQPRRDDPAPTEGT